MSENNTHVARFDKAVVRKAEVTPEGYLKADAIVTRTGVFQYLSADGSVRRELRHPDDVYQNQSLESLKMRPITNGHPASRLVTSDNAKELTIGFTGESVTLDGQYIVAPLLITDESGVRSVKSGARQELSLGYTVDLVEDEGVYNGESYTHRQTNIRYNHLAIVDRARAGQEARIHLDQGDAIIACDEDYVNINNNNKELEPMAEEKKSFVTLDGVEHQTSELVATAYSALAKKLDEAEAALEDAEKKLEAAASENKKLEAEQAENAEAEGVSEQDEAAAKIDHAELINAAVKRRVALIRDAEKLGVSVNMDSTDAEIMAEVVKSKCPKVNLDGATDVYLQARFDALLESTSEEQHPSSIATQRERVVAKLDAADISVSASRARMLERLTSNK